MKVICFVYESTMYGLRNVWQHPLCLPFMIRQQIECCNNNIYLERKEYSISSSLNAVPTIVRPYRDRARLFMVFASGICTCLFMVFVTGSFRFRQGERTFPRHGLTSFGDTLRFGVSQEPRQRVVDKEGIGV